MFVVASDAATQSVPVANGMVFAVVGGISVHADDELSARMPVENGTVRPPILATFGAG
jgi:hypothetical protein